MDVRVRLSLAIALSQGSCSWVAQSRRSDASDASFVIQGYKRMQGRPLTVQRDCVSPLTRVQPKSAASVM